MTGWGGKKRDEDDRGWIIDLIAFLIVAVAFLVYTFLTTGKWG